jgi:acyl carrier protein
MTKTEILELINNTIIKIANEFEIEINKEKEKMFVYSEKGTFDSMMLVVLLSEIEEELYSQFKSEVSLTSDKAMSKNTPFESNLSILDLILESSS